MIGNCSKGMLSILEKLNSQNDEENFINLENGDRLRISNEKKLLFMAENEACE